MTGTVTYSGTTATFSPAALLAANSAYTAEMIADAYNIKATVLAATRDILTSLGKASPAEEAARVEAYKTELATIEKKAHERERSAEAHRERYKALA